MNDHLKLITLVAGLLMLISLAFTALPKVSPVPVSRPVSQPTSQPWRWQAIFTNMTKVNQWRVLARPDQFLF